MEPDELEAMLEGCELQVPPTEFKGELLDRVLATDRSRRLMKWKIGMAAAAIAFSILLNVQSGRQLAALAKAERPARATSRAVTAFSLHLAQGQLIFPTIGS